jgi:hypothetical protein
MLRSRRLALISAAVLLGLTACGDTNQRTTAAQPPAVIHLGATNGGSPVEAATADRMMMPMQDVTYVVDGDIAELAATGAAWSFPGGAEPDLARIAEIARLLGVAGEVRALPADQGGGWMVGAADYTTATLTVSADGMLSWWYNPAPQVVSTVSSVVCEQSVAAPASDGTEEITATDATTDIAADVPAETVMPECAMPEPPANVPDEAAARQAAQQLFADMGYAADQLEYDVYADEWGANVTATLLLDGQRSPISTSVGFGADAAITWASGSLATPVPAGDYPLVGVDAGLARLSDETGRWSGYWGGPAMMARSEGSATAVPMPAVAAPAIADTIAADTVAADPATTEMATTGTLATGTGVAGGGSSESLPEQVGEPVAIVPPVCDGAAGDCMPEVMPLPEPVTVHLTGATLGLTMVWAQDGTAWLLPAYVFNSTDGGEYTVIAVDDAFLDLPGPYPTETVPVGSPPVTTAAPSATVDTANTVSVDVTTTVPAELAPPNQTITVDPAVAAELLVGLTLDEATVVADGQGWSLRVSTLDGIPQVVTADSVPTRVNVSVVAGAIAGIDNIG